MLGRFGRLVHGWAPLRDRIRAEACPLELAELGEQMLLSFHCQFLQDL